MTIKKFAKDFIGKKSSPFIFFFGGLIVFTFILLAHSSGYAETVDHGAFKNNGVFNGINGSHLAINYFESTTINLGATDLGHTVKVDADILAMSTARNGMKIYISSSEKSLKTADGVNEIPYDNLGNTQVLKSDNSPNTWAIFLTKENALGQNEEYQIPLCDNDNLTNECLLEEFDASVTMHPIDLKYGVNATSSLAPGTYSSKPLLLTGVISTSPTTEKPVTSVSPSVVPLDASGHTVRNEAGQKLKHRMKIEVPIMERDMEVKPNDYKKFKATAGGLDCIIDPTSLVKTTAGISFDCTVDFDTATPLFQAGQKTEVVVETIPYGYTFSKQNAIQFVNSWVDYGYTGTPQEFTFPVTGKYKLEVMGASGGPRTPVQQAFHWMYNKDFDPGLGGYSSGYKDFNAGDRVALFVGGRGEASLDEGVNPNIIHKGGFNGGGNGSVGPLAWGNANPNWRNWGGAGGGGGTDIRPVSDENYVSPTNPGYKLRYRTPGDSNHALNEGPWIPLDHGSYQAVFEVENIPDSDFDGAAAYYDLNSAIDKQFRNVYSQKHGNFISVYFTYDVNQPAPTLMPNTAAEVRLLVKTTNTTAKIKSLKFYKLSDRIIVGGGGAGGTLIAGGGHGGGLTGGATIYSGNENPPYTNSFIRPEGATQTSGAGYGFGGSAPRLEDNTRSLQHPLGWQIQGRPGAGGGWCGGFVAQTPYDLSTVASGASGGSGYIGGVTSGISRRFDDGGDTSLWPAATYVAGHDGYIRISYATYPGGTP